MTRRLAVAILSLAIVACAAWARAQTASPARTFPQFAGTWVLDESASTGRLSMAPPPSHTVTITTTPDAVTITKLLRLPPERPEVAGRRYATESPPPEIYRFDGAETIVEDQRDARRERRYSFRLVADALALTIRETSPNSGGAFTLVTDAYSVDGDVLTIHRQLSSVNPAGHIATMQEPTNNLRHTFIYRRGPR